MTAQKKKRSVALDIRVRKAFEAHKSVHPEVSGNVIFYKGDCSLHLDVPYNDEIHTPLGREISQHHSVKGSHHRMVVLTEREKAMFRKIIALMRESNSDLSIGVEEPDDDYSLSYAVTLKK